VIKKLLDAGVRLESVRDVFDYLRNQVDADIAAAHIVIDGNHVLLCEGDEWIDVVRRGQGVLQLLPVATVKSEIDEQIVNLYPGPEPAGALDTSRHPSAAMP
jgi:hypothetical protein